MVEVEVLEELKEEIHNRFKSESVKVFELIYSLKENPNRGNLLSNVGGIIIKELKYKKFRFYFITDGFKLRCLDENYLVDLLIKFVRMSDKKSQQKVIDEIKDILRRFGKDGF